MRIRLPQLVIGIALIALGTVFVLINLGVLEGESVWMYWPTLLIAIGTSRLLSDRGNGQPGSGFWILVIGIWLQISLIHAFGLGFKSSWPLLVIAWGISLLWRSPINHSKWHLERGHTHGE
jgi:hypothetical protein